MRPATLGAPAAFGIIRADELPPPQVNRVALACAPGGRLTSTAIKAHESNSGEVSGMVVVIFDSTVPGTTLYKMQGPHAARWLENNWIQFSIIFLKTS